MNFKNFKLKRIALIFSAGCLLTLISNYINYKRYYSTIFGVQTVDFNILSHVLPTKLSYALLQNNNVELQNTLDSNYNLFGLVVTDCKTNDINCPEQKILFSTNYNSKYSTQYTLNDLKNNPYDLLKDPIPLLTEYSYPNSSAKTRVETGQKNKGEIIGRVYYLRRNYPTFWQTQLDILTTSGNVNLKSIYIITVTIFSLLGTLIYFIIELLEIQKQQKINQLKNDLLNNSQKVNQLKLKLKKTYNENKEIINTAKEIKNKNKAIEEQLQTIIEYKNKKESEIEESKNKIDNLQKQLQSLQENYVIDEQEQIKLEKQIEKQKIILTKQESDYQEKEEELNNVQIQLEESKQKEQELKLLLQQTEKEISYLENNIENLESQIKLLTEEKEKLEKEIGKLKSKIEKLEFWEEIADDIEKSEDNIKSLENQINNIKKEKQELINKLQIKELIIQELTISIQASQEQNKNNSSTEEELSDFPQELTQRFSICYPSLKFNQRALKQMGLLNNEKRNSVERIFGLLQHNINEVTIKDTVKGSHDCILEIQFKDDGRLYITRSGNEINILNVGNKHSQIQDIQWLKQHY